MQIHKRNEFNKCVVRRKLLWNKKPKLILSKPVFCCCFFTSCKATSVEKQAESENVAWKKDKKFNLNCVINGKVL